jgi:hypothetical protein
VVGDAKMMTALPTGRETSEGTSDLRAAGARGEWHLEFVNDALQNPRSKQEHPMQDLEQIIRERAYHLWQESGYVEGKAESHWLTTQREILQASFGERGRVAIGGLLSGRRAVPGNLYFIAIPLDRKPRLEM